MTVLDLSPRLFVLGACSRGVKPRALRSPKPKHRRARARSRVRERLTLTGEAPGGGERGWPVGRGCLEGESTRLPQRCPAVELEDGQREVAFGRAPERVSPRPVCACARRVARVASGPFAVHRTERDGGSDSAVRWEPPGPRLGRPGPPLTRSRSGNLQKSPRAACANSRATPEATCARDRAARTQLAGAASTAPERQLVGGERAPEAKASAGGARFRPSARAARRARRARFFSIV